MYRLLLTVLVITYVLSSNAQAGAYIELGTGFNRNLTGCTDCWNDAGADMFGAYGRLGYDWHVVGNTTIGVHWVHLSQWFEGPPFGETEESSVDHLGVYVRWELF
jgi:hypothetical protein